MSYILDALRRAQAERERERDGVPGLDAQPSPPLPADEAEPAHRNAPWRWIVVGLAAGLAVAIGWRWLEHDTPVQATARAVDAPARSGIKPLDTAAADKADSPAPPVTADSAAPPRMSLPPPMNSALDAKAARPVENAAAPRTAEAAAPASAAANPPDRSLPTATPVPSPRADAVNDTAVAAPAAAASAKEPDTRIVPLAELPEALRRELPPLAVGGATFSEHPGSRLLILNGQLLHEGDRPATGLTLLQIQLKSAVFDYKGTRFRLSY